MVVLERDQELWRLVIRGNNGLREVVESQWEVVSCESFEDTSRLEYAVWKIILRDLV